MTATGRGTAGGSPCRLWADGERVDATVTGVAGLPATGVEAVALSVTAGPSNTDASLTAGPTGATGHGLRRLDTGPDPTEHVAHRRAGRRRRAGELLDQSRRNRPLGERGRLLHGRDHAGAEADDLRRCRAVPPDVSAAACSAWPRWRLRTTRVVDVSTLAGLPADATAAVVTLTARSVDCGGTVLVTHAWRHASLGAQRDGRSEAAAHRDRHRADRSGRSLDVVNRSTTTMVVNAHLVGYYAPAARPGGLLYRWRLPRRVVDTRPGRRSARRGPRRSVDRLCRGRGRHGAGRRAPGHRHRRRPRVAPGVLRP